MKTKLNKITLSGEVASGKSTIGKLLADQLEYKFISIGYKTREYAQSKGLTIVEFQKECLLNPELDKQIDHDFANDCNKQNNLIIDYRLGFKFITNAFNVYLKISEEEAVRRLEKANRINETHRTVRERNDSFKKQFSVAYGIDYTNESNYDLILEVSEYDNINKIVNEILLAFESKNKKQNLMHRP